MEEEVVEEVDVGVAVEEVGEAGIVLLEEVEGVIQNHHAEEADLNHLAEVADQSHHVVEVVNQDLLVEEVDLNPHVQASHLDLHVESHLHANQNLLVALVPRAGHLQEQDPRVSSHHGGDHQEDVLHVNHQQNQNVQSLNIPNLQSLRCL